jgi:hypothetical protein
VTLDRGADARVRTLDEEGNLNWTDPAAREKYRKIETEFLEARSNAVTMLRVNVSLAIRNALDAIHEHRKHTGASLDWSTCTNRHEHYQEIGPDGWPIETLLHGEDNE